MAVRRAEPSYVYDYKGWYYICQALFTQNYKFIKMVLNVG